MWDNIPANIDPAGGQVYGVLRKIEFTGVIEGGNGQGATSFGGKAEGAVVEIFDGNLLALVPGSFRIKEDIEALVEGVDHILVTALSGFRVLTIDEDTHSGDQDPKDGDLDHLFFAEEFVDAGKGNCIDENI